MEEVLPEVPNVANYQDIKRKSLENEEEYDPNVQNNQNVKHLEILKTLKENAINIDMENLISKTSKLGRTAISKSYRRSEVFQKHQADMFGSSACSCSCSLSAVGEGRGTEFQNYA